MKDLNSLFSPKTIALIGANEGDGFGGAVARNLIKYAVDIDKVFFVSLKNEYVFNKKCYKSLSEIPYNIDLVVIATNKNTVIDIVKEAKIKGAKACVVYASGFSETGDTKDLERENELKKLSNELDILIEGPNCAGFVNYKDDINTFAFLSQERDRRGHIAVISQSGMISLSIIDSQWPKMTYNVSVGNANIITYNEYLEFMIRDVDTKVIALHIDTMVDIDAFIKNLALAKSKNVPIVLYKSGSNQKSREMSKMHTGAIDSITNEEFDEIIKKYGVIRVDDLEELIYISTFFSLGNGKISGKNIAAINFSGGEAGIVTDVGYHYDVNFPDFDDDLVLYLKNNLPSYAHISNPLDMTATLSYDTERLSIVISKILSSKNINALLIGYTLLNKVDDKCIYYLIDAIKIARKKLDENDVRKPIFLLSFMSNTRDEECIKKLEDEKIIVLPSPKYGFSILEKLIN